MRTTIQIKSAQGSLVSITVEHDEPMSLSTEQILPDLPAEKKIIDCHSVAPDQQRKTHKPCISSKPAICANPSCGKSFVRKSNRQQFCSRACRYQAEKIKLNPNTSEKPKKKICLKCQLNFESSVPGELFCSECRPKNIK
jgi:hypothetical protein